MTTLHFVRHGQSTWNAETRIQGSSDPELTTLGIEQAKSLHGSLPTFDRIYCSDLKRTRQTAHHLLNGETQGINYQSSLREIHLGPWEGMLLADAIEQFPEQTDYFRNQPDKFSLPGAETFHQLQQRARKAIAAILDECSDTNQRVLVVSHGALLKSLLIDYAGWPINQLWHDPQMANCGQSIVTYKGNQATMTKFADATEW